MAHFSICLLNRGKLLNINWYTCSAVYFAEVIRPDVTPVKFQLAPSSVCSSLSLTPVQNKNHDAAQVWDHNCGRRSSAELMPRRFKTFLWREYYKWLQPFPKRSEMVFMERGKMLALVSIRLISAMSLQWRCLLGQLMAWFRRDYGALVSMITYLSLTLLITSENGNFGLKPFGGNNIMEGKWLCRLFNRRGLCG